MRGRGSLRLIAAWACVAASAAAEDLVRFDFETGDLQGWRVVEGQFDELVSRRDVYHNQYPDQPGNRYNKQGRCYLSTVEQKPGLPSNDRMVGVVESPVFVLEGPGMSLLVGAGTHPRAYVALCALDGTELLVARGKPDTEVMQRILWNVPQLLGQRVFLRAVDRETGGWGHVTLDDVVATGRVDPEATVTRWREVGARRQRERVEALVAECAPKALRAAIRDLTESSRERYPEGPAFLARLDALEARIATAPLEEAEEAARALTALRRTALLANPLLAGRRILYVVRSQYRSHYHAIDTLFHTGELNADRGMTPHADLFQGGGALKTFDPATGRTETLVETPAGVVRDPEVDFDGTRIVFAMRRHRDEDYHIWTIAANGTELRQLTSARGVSDFDPFFLPDGGIAFSSTREPKYNQCSRDHGANLFRMEADGANILQIGKNNLFDNHGSLLADGRILYARWEYVDRNFGDAHGVWTVHPDGTSPSIWWGNNTASPGAVYYPRSIPGSDRIVCIFGMHHFRLWGALAIVDRARGLDGPDAVVRTWPADAIDRVRAAGPFDCDGFVSVHPKYECPWPLSERHVLCSRMTMRPGQTTGAPDAQHGEEMGIYLVDVHGNELLVHCEPPGCWDPMPIASRPRPPVLPARRDLENAEGRFYVADVYRGTHMHGVERGSVKRLRVVESPEKRHWAPGAWFGQGYTAPGMNWHGLENKRILGTVPVEEDGSAHFAAPSETFVYFQLLDADGMMVQSMRSGASVQSGEVAGCVGCHEGRLEAPGAAPPGGIARLALRRAPSRLEGWYGPPRKFGYAAEVQPVLDRRCVRCHDFGTPAGKKLVLASDRSICFNASYEELWRKGYVRCVGAGPAEIQPARSWGSHASPLVEELLRPKVPEHRDVRLSAEELDRIITWVDLNGVYYPDYDCAYPESLTGRCPLDNAQLSRLGALCGIAFDQTRSYSTSIGPQISFERPELSPCLRRFPDRSDAGYAEALGIIAAGTARLASRPRRDMPGFVASDADLRREAWYEERRRVELRNREAIRRGEHTREEPAPGSP